MQWYTVFSTAKREPFQYEIEKVGFEDFYKWDSVTDKYFTGNLTGKISLIRIVTFKKNEPSTTISVKYTMNRSAKPNEIESQKLTFLLCHAIDFDACQFQSKNIWGFSLTFIPAHFQHEYINIPRSLTEKDTLLESDIEDIEADKT